MRIAKVVFSECGARTGKTHPWGWGVTRGGRCGVGQPASEGPPYFLSSLAGAGGGVLGVSQAEGGGNTMIEPVAVCPGGTRAGTS